ncbi:MAG: dUTP diphosphatase [Treponema sp.]|jgi:dUTP pyrophosphatase|nr:dUTP diphosphatase [Treponema sp.]
MLPRNDLSPVLGILKKEPRVQLPQYASEGAAGLDLRAFLDEPLVIPPLERRRIPTGLIPEIPAGFEGQVRPRSGLASRNGVSVLNAPGTIDSDYRGELEVLLVNLGSEPFTVHDGDRIAQLVIAPVCRVSVVEKDVLSETGRGAGGFGSTGI